MKDMEPAIVFFCKLNAVNDDSKHALSSLMSGWSAGLSTPRCAFMRSKFFLIILSSFAVSGDQKVGVSEYSVEGQVIVYEQSPVEDPIKILTPQTFVSFIVRLKHFFGIIIGSAHKERVNLPVKMPKRCCIYFRAIPV
jgi:hypothetical protein